jgi:hypothetical protein
MSNQTLSSLIVSLQDLISKNGDISINYNIDNFLEKKKFTVRMRDYREEIILHLSINKSNKSIPKSNVLIRMDLEKYNKFKYIFYEAISYIDKFKFQNNKEYDVNIINFRKVKKIPSTYESKDGIFYYKNTSELSLYKKLIYALFNDYVNDSPWDLSNDNKYETEKSNYITLNYDNKVLYEKEFKFDISIVETNYHIDNITDDLEYIDMLYDFYYTFQEKIDEFAEEKEKNEKLEKKSNEKHVYGENEYYYLMLKNRKSL